MLAGTTIFRPETCDIDADVEVGPDTVIEPFVQLIGKTKIGADCRIRSYSVISNCELGDGVLILPGCMLEDSVVRNRAQLGPYSHLRPGSDIGEGAHIGNFVETKKTRVGKGSKANHLTYLGDSEIGEGVNIGAGTITCNYDGVNKYPTVIDDGAFIGSDATLVAPVRIGKSAYVGAGSCITEDVPADALALGRGRQVTKGGLGGGGAHKNEKVRYGIKLFVGHRSGARVRPPDSRIIRTTCNCIPARIPASSSEPWSCLGVPTNSSNKCLSRRANQLCEQLSLGSFQRPELGVCGARDGVRR